MSEALEATIRRFDGMQGEALTAAMPLEKDTVRRFVQAIMDTDPAYFDEAVASSSKAGGVAAPPLYPVHAFRQAAGTPDPLESLTEDHAADGTAGSHGMSLACRRSRRRSSGC